MEINLNKGNLILPARIKNFSEGTAGSASQVLEAVHRLQAAPGCTIAAL